MHSQALGYYAKQKRMVQDPSPWNAQMVKLVNCPPRQNPLYSLVDKTAYTFSTVVSITGHKRSGKSLLMARMLNIDMHGGRRVWSSMPVTTPPFLLKLGLKELKSEDIDWNMVMTLDDEYIEGTLGIDEGINVADKRNSATVKNKLVNAAMNQVGHRNLNVYTTVKRKNWMDGRFDEEVDLEIRCRDIALLPWGRQHHVTRGTMIRLDFFDHSGAVTGREFHPKYNYRPFRTLVWKNADKWWPSYDTKKVTSLEETFTRVRLDLVERVISNKKNQENEIQEMLFNIASELKSRGNETVPCDTFWNVAQEFGVEGDSRNLGKYLKHLGIKRKEKRGGNIYELNELVPEFKGM